MKKLIFLLRITIDNWGLGCDIFCRLVVFTRLVLAKAVRFISLPFLVLTSDLRIGSTAFGKISTKSTCLIQDSADLSLFYAGPRYTF